MKASQLWTDSGEANIDFHFIRDRLKYFSERLNIQGIQVVNRKNYIKEHGNIIVVSADRWLTTLP